MTEPLEEVLVERRITRSKPIEGNPPRYDLKQDEGPVRSVAAKLLSYAKNGGSMLTGNNVWTDENVETLFELFVKQPDVSGDNFFEKLDKQFSGTADDVRVLFAEMLALQMLPIGYRPETKIENIDRVLGGVNAHYEIPEELNEAFRSPVFGGGPAFSARRYHQLSVLIEFVRYLRRLSPEELDAASKDPLAWRRIVLESPGTAEPSLRASLTYLGHPEYFFPIVSERHKRAIVSAFFPSVTKRPPLGDDDADLAALREWMAPGPGLTPDFYSGPLSDFWNVPGKDSPDSGGTDAPPLTDAESADEAGYSVESIIEDGAFHSVEDLRAIIDRWKESRNIVLQGAPGTGKTWLARRLAFALIGSKDEVAVRSVQFHPGTSYEDFVRGWRPGEDGRLTLVDGPLLQHAQRANEYPDIPHVVIIEEFNRGNPAQALGEMLTLLERTKRSAADALELTYHRKGEKSFFLPDNLYVAGTMNTADRSLALVDFALRRRFAFFELEPQFTDAWKRHLQSRFRSEPQATIDETARRILWMNERIGSDVSLGPSYRIGHSYFTAGKEASEFRPWYRSVVLSSVTPQLSEYWHEDPETVQEIVNQLLSEF